MGDSGVEERTSMETMSGNDVYTLLCTIKERIYVPAASGVNVMIWSVGFLLLLRMMWKELAPDPSCTVVLGQKDQRIFCTYFQTFTHIHTLIFSSIGYG